jgi:hypothetical protein
MATDMGNGPHDQSQHEDEVRERWGETDAYKESKKRTANFSPEDWERIEKEREEVEKRLAQFLRSGVAPDSQEAMEAAEAHRRHIGNFYPCPPAMHVGLGQMYTADPRFADHYDQREPGLAEFLAAAIRANAERIGKEG